MLEAVGLKEIFAKEDNAFYLRKTVEELASAEKAKSEVKKVCSQRRVNRAYPVIACIIVFSLSSVCLKGRIRLKQSTG